MVLRVAVPAPVPTLFDYLPPLGVLPSELAPGMRVRVPFGTASRVGLLIELAAESDQPLERLKLASSLLDRAPLIDAAELRYWLWAAHYYHHPVGDALLGALPLSLRRGGTGSEGPVSGWRLTPAGWAADPTLLARAPRQQALWHCLREATEGLDRLTLSTRCGDSPAALRALVARGWVEPLLAPPGLVVATSPPAAEAVTLNRDQARAVDSVTACLGRFAAFLLEGVTGSGKTEVYLRVMSQALARAGQVLLLVPEIGLTPQLIRRLATRLGAPFGVLHSGLPEGERARTWLRARDGDLRVVVGTRSAVFAPLPQLALILVDEEHDLSFKQQEGYRYHARDLAVWRARQRGCPVVLGTATPALETLDNVARGRYRMLLLPQRAGPAQLPRVDLIDIRSQPLRGGLSPVLQRLVGETLAAGRQVMLFLNRRGYAPVVTCHDCGWISDCPRCDARLTLHRESHRLWCHHCGHQRPLPAACPDCGRTNLRPLGQGTERLEAELGTIYPGVPLARIDRDSTRRKGALQQLVNAAERGETRILLGTQMLAKGHHFPDLTLVGILDLDQALYGTDFRAPERMAQLLIQVAGRAGRVAEPGRVLVQTRHPGHPLLLTLIREGYRAFAAAALAERRQAGLPPASAQALVRAEAPGPERPAEFLTAALASAARWHGPEIALWGPVPAPMVRRAGRYRAHLLAQAAGRAELQTFLARWVPELYRLPSARGVRWSLDVDPQELL